MFTFNCKDCKDVMIIFNDMVWNHQLSNVVCRRNRGWVKCWVPLGLLGGIGLGRGPFLCATSTLSLLNTFQKLDRAKHQHEHESYLCLDYDSLIFFARCSSAVNALADHETRFLRKGPMLKFMFPPLSWHQITSWVRCARCSHSSGHWDLIGIVYWDLMGFNWVLQCSTCHFYGVTSVTNITGISGHSRYLLFLDFGDVVWEKKHSKWENRQ